MSASRTPAFSRLNRTHRVSIAALGVVGAASLAFSVAPGHGSTAVAAPASHTVAAAPAALATPATGSVQTAALHASIANQQLTADGAAKAQATAFAKATTKAKSAEAAKAHATAEAKAKAAAKAAAKAKAAKAHAAAKKAAAKHHTAVKHHTVVKHHTAKHVSRSVPRRPLYANNLNGWIHQSLSIMKQHHIPGSYNGIYRNVMRESSGNPQAINLWDINAQNGIPSKGLLQVIPPTFKTYHVAGTSKNIYNPVANIVAACNYAADKYGSMDNVNSAY
jgi:hypothetical protein